MSTCFQAAFFSCMHALRSKRITSGRVVHAYMALTSVIVLSHACCCSLMTMLLFAVQDSTPLIGERERGRVGEYLIRGIDADGLELSGIVHKLMRDA